MNVGSLARRGLRKVAAAMHPLVKLPVVGPWFRRLGHRVVPAERLEVMRVRSGIAEGLDFELFPSTCDPFVKGEVEPVVAQAISALVGPGTVFYDLGANMGYFSLGVARTVGARGQVFAFEADPDMGDRLERNLARNGLPNLELVRAAVWSEGGTVTFARVDPERSPDRGLGHVTQDGQSTGGMITVQAVTLDGFMKAHPAPTLIKCDVEGAEVEVFQGAEGLLKLARPAVICEMHAEEKGTYLEGMFADLGYACSWLDETHLLARP